MGLLDLFTGAASERAARSNASAIRAGQTLGADALTKGYGQATSYLGLNPEGGGALGALRGGFDRARTDVAGGYDAAAPMLARLGGAYDPMVAGGQRAFDAFLDGSGANGADGAARARANFRAGPGYEFARDQGIETIQRTAAARGGLAGGNTTADLLRFSQGLADQEFDDYLGNLKVGASFLPTALSGQAQGLGTQANAAIGRGTALGALGSGLGASEAAVFGQGANLQTGFGRDVANVQTGATQNTISNNNNLAASRNAAGANVLGALVGFGQLASGGAGGFAGRATGGIRGGGGANVSPYANNPFLSFASNLGNMFS